jgi:hypothetical protein
MKNRLVQFYYKLKYTIGSDINKKELQFVTPCSRSWARTSDPLINSQML